MNKKRQSHVSFTMSHDCFYKQIPFYIVLKALVVTLTVFSAGSEQIYNVEMWTQVAHDLQFRHQRLGLAPPGGSCSAERERHETNILRPGPGCAVLPNGSKPLWQKPEPVWQPR